MRLLINTQKGTYFLRIASRILHKYVLTEHNGLKNRKLPLFQLFNPFSKLASHHLVTQQNNGNTEFQRRPH